MTPCEGGEGRGGVGGGGRGAGERRQSSRGTCRRQGRGGGVRGCPCSHEVETRAVYPVSWDVSSPNTQTPAAHTAPSQLSQHMPHYIPVKYYTIMCMYTGHVLHNEQSSCIIYMYIRMHKDRCTCTCTCMYHV